jgi:hypothetical protein
MSKLLLATDAGAQSSDTIRIIAIDADVTGNTATSLGPLNACTRAEPGSNVVLDLVVDAVPASRPFIAFQVDIVYDPTLLTLTTTDNEFLLGANGTFEPFEGLSDPLPDTDGRYTIIVADLSQLELAESGPGVLTRLTFAAKGRGMSTVGPGFNPPDQYPALIDVENTTIGVDAIGEASVAVGQDCTVAPEATPVITDLPPIDQIPGLQTPVPTPTAAPGEETPGSTGSGDAATPTSDPGDDSGTPGPTRTESEDGNVTSVDEGDGGTSAGTVVAVAALALAGVGLAGGGTYLLVRRRGMGGAGGAAP